MSHIDEGTLHAYLDGALDLYPAGEADRVRSHLEACADCRARLEEERAVRDEAETILAAAAPDVSLPPFEELRAEAARRGSPAKARRLSRMNRWAWAASVVVALGTGWMLRGSIGEWVSQPLPGEDAAPPSVTAPPAAAEAPADADEAQGNRQEVAATPEAAEGSTSGEASATRTGAADEAPGVLNDEVGAPPPPVSTAAAPEVPAEATTEPAVKELEVSAPAGAGAERPGGEERLAPSAAARRGEVAPSAADFALEPRATARVVPTTAELEAPSADSAYAFVPGMTVVDTGRFPQGSLRIRQLTEGGDTLEVIHLPAGVEPPLVSAPAPEGVNEVVAFRRGTWIILRGRLDQDALLALAERIPFGG